LHIFFEFYHINLAIFLKRIFVTAKLIWISIQVPSWRFTSSMFVKIIESVVTFTKDACIRYSSI